MERRRLYRFAHDVWSEPDRLAHRNLRRVNPRSRMTRHDQRVLLVIWVLSIGIALMTLAQVFDWAVALLKG